MHAFLTSLNNLRSTKASHPTPSTNLSTTSTKSSNPLLTAYNTTKNHEIIHPTIRSLQAMYIQHGRAQTSHGLFLPRMSDSIDPLEHHAYVPRVLSILAEVLYWARPTVYTGSKIYFGNHSWVPWFLSAICDSISNRLSHATDLSPAQMHVWDTRTKLYLYYLLRSPFFDNITLIPLRLLSQILQPIPGLGLFTTTLLQLAASLQQTYFYTAAS
uniref:Peroxisomal membrane protein PEX16 n=1 Tax=Lygus hesperus TaxID=30085 RepID=A0A146MF33_LYGHE